MLNVPKMEILLNDSVVDRSIWVDFMKILLKVERPIHSEKRQYKGYAKLFCITCLDLFSKLVGKYLFYR